MEEVCLEILTEHGVKVRVEELERGIREAEEYYEEKYWEDDTFWASEAEAEKMWTELYAVFLRNLGVKEDLSMAELIYEEFGRASRWALFPDVLPTMEELSRMGMIMGVISNWDARLSSLCLDLKLSPYLNFVISSACVGKIKPEPAIFQMALERSGVLAGEAIHVGDHYYADVLGARSMGLIPVLLDRWGKSGTLDCMVIKSLEELPALVRDYGVSESQP